MCYKAEAGVQALKSSYEIALTLKLFKLQSFSSLLPIRTSFPEAALQPEEIVHYDGEQYGWMNTDVQWDFRKACHFGRHWVSCRSCAITSGSVVS